MDSLILNIPNLLFSGLANLFSYLAAHVLLCLLPAFLIAGAMTAFIPKEMITRYLGRNTSKWISYPAAAAAGFLLAVCSCTVIPLFAGIYKKGAGIGPAITFLFVAPAVNILALTYTGTVIGLDLAVARLVLSLAFGIGIGLLMALLFNKEDEKHDQETDALFTGKAGMRPATTAFILIMVVLLLVGTLQVGFLKHSYFDWTIPVKGLAGFQTKLNELVPFDPARGEEGLTLQGVIMIGMLILIGISAYKGIEKIHEGFNGWTWAAVILVGLTVLLAALGLAPTATGLTIQITGKFIGVLGCVILLGWLLRFHLTDQEKRDFLWESWKFIKQIFPLLIAGVFVVGIIREVIDPAWVKNLAGQNTFTGNLIGVLFGVFMYFPTLVEVPIAQMFLDLGMHRGPLLAYLISDPELSLQSILITATLIGRLKAWVYVAWVALFSTLAGLIYGAWVDGKKIVWIILFGILFVVVAGGVTGLLKRHKTRERVDHGK